MQSKDKVMSIMLCFDTDNLTEVCQANMNNLTTAYETVNTEDRHCFQSSEFYMIRNMLKRRVQLTI